MSTSASNSINTQTASGTGSEQFNRGNRRNNDRRQRGGRGGRGSRGGRPYHSRYSYRGSRTAAAASRALSNSNGEQSSISTNESNGEQSSISINEPNGEQSSISTNESICFICREPVQYYAVSECNHKFCHLCSLRLRALYQNKNCAYCKTEQIKVIFTRNPDKEFKEFKEHDIPYSDEKLNAYFEDREMFEDIKILLTLNCPDPKCEKSYEGWGELKRHIRIDHHLSLCEICTRHKKIFAHEHSLFTYEELGKHRREGDENTGFKGHPECQFCKMNFYGDDELYEHCRHRHEECFICVKEGIRHNYYRDYNLLEEHFKLGHYLCLNEECLEKKFVVFESDIDLKAHEVNVHGVNFGGQRARHEARKIETNFNFGDSHTRGRGRGRRRSRERQPERRTYGDGVVVDEITRQTQNLNLDSTTPATNGAIVNARAVRPPPGFGVLSSDEVIGPADELPINEMEIHNVASPSMRQEDFPSLRDAVKVTTTSNNSGTAKNYSEKARKKADKPTQSIKSVASSSKSVTPNSPQQPPFPLFESTNITKGKSSAFPPLPSANQSTSASSSSTSVLNYREKALPGSEISSRNFGFYQRVNGFLSNNSVKMEEFMSLTEAYSESVLDASSYIELLLPLFNKNKDIFGKIVSGLVEILEDEKKKPELLRAWQDHKAMQIAITDFPALEPISSPTHSMITNSKPNIKTPSPNKPSARVLVIKSSTTRSGGTKAISGSRFWDKIAAIAESKNKEKNDSTFPSLAAAGATTSTSSNNDVWKGSAPQFVQSPPRSESTSSVNYPTTSSYTTAFVKGRPTKAENEEYPGLPLTPKSQQRSKNDGPEKNAWGQGGTFTSIVSDDNQNENDSEDDSSVSAKEGGKKKKQKKQKTVLYRNY